MCTAVSLNLDNHYFGRNLDYFHSFGQTMIITPRNYKFTFTNGIVSDSHFAIIGMALENNNYPLYFDAANEKGLCVAGLNFPQFCRYNKSSKNKVNIASFELIPWILSQCDSAKKAARLCENINITNTSFSPDLPPTPMHWIISDKLNSYTLEQTKYGLKIYENPVGVLTNSPSFDIQMINLSHYVNITNNNCKNKFMLNIDIKPYSNGLGAYGIPGDFSSMSRFVRVSFLKLSAVKQENEIQNINTFFHILYSVYQLKGSVQSDNGYMHTYYTSCIDTDKCIYYYTSYDKHDIYSLSLFDKNLDTNKLFIF